MIALRRAGLDDWADLYRWRNDPETRAASVHTAPVPLEDHLKWLKATLAKRTTRVFVARDPSVGSAGLGTGRLEEVGKEVVVSITIAPAYRGRGYAVALITALVEQARSDFPKAKAIVATIRTTNYASLSAFARCGFVVRKIDGDFVDLVHEQ